MKIQPSKELETLAVWLKTDCETVSKQIIEVLTNLVSLEHNIVNYGTQIKDHYDKKQVRSFELMARCLGLNRTRSWQKLRIFDNLVIIGDDDCPNCGGYITEVVTGEYRVLEKETNNQPADIEIQKAEVCLVCGEKFKVFYE